MKNAASIADLPNLALGDVFDLETAYDQYVTQIPRSDRGGVFHPSAVGSCKRKQVYEYVGTTGTKSITYQDQETFDVGHLVHAFVQERLANLNVVLGPQNIQYSFRDEVPFDPATDRLFTDLCIGGTTDGILELWTPEWRQRGIVEVKSIKGKNFDKLRGPKIDHVRQAHIYAYRFDCPIMWIWYFDKNEGLKKVYPVLFEKKIFNEALGVFSGMLAHVDAGTLPDREESFWECPRCSYKDICRPKSIDKINAQKRKKSASNLLGRAFRK